MALQGGLGDRLVTADLTLELLDPFVPHLVIAEGGGVRDEFAALGAADGPLVLGVGVEGQHALGDEPPVAVGAFDLKRNVSIRFTDTVV